MYVTCWPFSGESSGITAATTPKPTSEMLHGEDDQGGPVVGLREVEVEGEHGDAEDDCGADDAVDDGVDAPMPSRWVTRLVGLMNVYSIVPSHRSHCTVSESTSKIIER